MHPFMDGTVKYNDNIILCRHAPARGARKAGLRPVGKLLVAHAGDHHHGLLQHGVLFLVKMLAVVGL